MNLEVSQAERDYDLNRAAELKYGTLMTLQKQLKVRGECCDWFRCYFGEAGMPVVVWPLFGTCVEGP